MEKREGNRLKEQDDEDFQIRDPEIYLEEKAESDHLEPTRQLQKNKVTIQNVKKQDLLQSTEKNDESRTEKEGLEQEMNVKQKVERSKENLVLTQDSIPRLETVAVNQECVELAEDEMLELEKNIAVGIKTENIEEILPGAAKDPIPAAEYDLNDAAQEEWDRIAKNENLEANEALKQRKELQRKLSTLCSKKEGLQQPCEISVKVKEEQEIETKHRLLETPTEDREAQYVARDKELFQRGKKIEKALADFFDNQNQVKMQQRTDNLKGTFFTPVQDKTPTAEHDSNDAAHEELDRPDKEWMEMNAISQERRDQPRKPSVSSTEEGLQLPYEVMEETGKVKEKQEIVMHQKSATPDNDIKTLAETVSQNQKLMQQKKNPQNNAHNINNSENVESQKPKQTITYREWQELGEAWRREYGEASFEEVLARSRDPKQNATVCHPEVKEGGKLKCSKDFSLHSLESDDIATRSQGMNDHLSVLARGTVRPQKPKSYMTFPFRELTETERIYETKDCLTLQPQRSENEAVRTCRDTTETRRFSKTKDYVTLQPRRSDDETVLSSNTKDYVTLQPRMSDNETVLTCRETTETAGSSKTKDYVTLRPRRSDDETVRTCREIIETVRSTKTKDYVTVRPRRSENENTTISKGVPSALKDYVTTHHVDQNTTPSDPQPPTPIFCPVQENASGPGPSTQMQTPSLSLKEQVATPKSNLHMPLGTQQLKLEVEEKTSPPSRMCSPQDLTSPTHRRRRVTENCDAPLLSFMEDCPEVTVVTDEPVVQRNRSLSTGTRGFMQWIHNHFNIAEGLASSMRFSKCRNRTLCGLCFLLMVVSLIILGITLYQIYNFNLKMNTSVIAVKNYHQSESLDGTVSIPMTRLDVTEIDSNGIFSTPMAGIDVNTDMDGEIIPLVQGLNDNVNTKEINSESNMATPVTNLDDRLINFGVTTPISDIDVNIITHVTDWESHVINPVTYLDNVMNPVSCLENVITPVADDNDLNPVTDVDSVINPVTGLENSINPVTNVDKVTNPGTNLDISVINVTYSNIYNYLRRGFEP